MVFLTPLVIATVVFAVIALRLSWAVVLLVRAAIVSPEAHWDLPAKGAVVAAAKAAAP